MIDLNTYLNNISNGMQLSKQQKEKLVALDRLFWEVAQMYHKDKPRYVTNISEECDKFLKSYKAKGKRISNFEIASIVEIEPREIEDAEVEDVTGEAELDDTDVVEPDRSDDEVRDEINGQQRIF